MANLKRTAVLIVAMLAVLALFFLRKGYEHNPSYLSGDEPHYVMMTDSLVKDGDFNLKNDYELNRAINYYPVPGLFPHLSPLINKNSPNWYSIHTVGLPFIMYVPYGLFGVIGARMWLIILQFSAVFVFYLILKRYLTSSRAKWFGVVLLLACPLFWQNLGAVFPDLLLVAIWGSAILLFDSEDWHADLLLAALVLLGGLVHTKGLVLIAPILLFKMLWLAKKHGVVQWIKKYKLSLVVLVIGLLAYVRFLHQRYGVLSPSQLYGQHGQLFAANPIGNTIAILTDRNKGIFVYFPVLVVSGSYLYRALADIAKTTQRIIHKKIKLAKNHFLVAGLSVGLVGLLITQIGFLDWSGSTAPNGRYMLPFIFVAIFVIARYASFRSRLETFVLGTATAAGGLLSIYSILDFKYYMSTGVNSFWLNRFHFLIHLPMFNMTATDNGRAPAVRGAELLILVLMLNVVLYVLYGYRITFKKRT